MHICMITGIFPPDIGGPATYVSRLASALHQKHHTVCVITLGEDVAGYPFPVKKVSRTYSLPLRLAVLFVFLIRYGWRSDIWYINGLELPAVLAGKLLRKRMVMKIVGDYAWERAMNLGLTTDCIDEFQYKKQHWKVEIHKKLRAWLTRQVKRVITPSQYLKKLVCGWGVSNKRIDVIYNAVEQFPEDVGTKSEIRKQLGFSENDRLIITVGRLVSWKGIDQLIQAIPHLDCSVKLLVIGDGPEKNKLTELARALSVTTHVQFWGKANRSQVLSCLRASDIFVLNTAYEGFSHVLLEAMMVGVPVITTPAGGNPELVAHLKNGILIEQNTGEELTKQLSNLLDNVSLQTKLIEEGKAAAQRYSWDRLLQQTIGVLLRVCGDQKGEGSR